MIKTAIVTGITGQDGSYLAELLLEKDYTVIGLHRRSSINNFERINHLFKNPNFKLEECDLTDPSRITNIVSNYQPHEIYNLAAQSHVGTSFKQPTTTFEINTIGVTNILEAIRSTSSSAKFYQASTSEMFGKNIDIDKNGISYQNEQTYFIPQSPYGIAKLAAHNMVNIYRSGYGVFGCCGILFNHESPRRGENFVTRKITKYIGQLLSGKTTDTLKLGNLNAHRDWGHAKDYVEAMYLMLQNDIPDDYVIATGETHSIYEFLKIAFDYVNLDYTKYIEIDPNLYRPAEVDYLRGVSDKARTVLNWQPKYSFLDLVKDMVDSDIKYYAS